jgi:hypothetical protein
MLADLQNLMCRGETEAFLQPTNFQSIVLPREDSCVQSKDHCGVLPACL